MSAKRIEEEMSDAGKLTIGHGSTLNATGIPGTEGPPGKMGTVATFIPGIQAKHLIDYKYNEGNLVKEIQSYIDATYNQHYSRNKFQATEFIIEAIQPNGAKTFSRLSTMQLCNSMYTTLKIRINYGY